MTAQGERVVDVCVGNFGFVAMDEDDETAKLVQAVRNVKSWMIVEKARITGSGLSWGEGEPAQDQDHGASATFVERPRGKSGTNDSFRG